MDSNSSFTRIIWDRLKFLCLIMFEKKQQRKEKISIVCDLTKTIDN